MPVPVPEPNALAGWLFCPKPVPEVVLLLPNKPALPLFVAPKAGLFADPNNPPPELLVFVLLFPNPPNPLELFAVVVPLPKRPPPELVAAPNADRF